MVPAIFSGCLDTRFPQTDYIPKSTIYLHTQHPGRRVLCPGCGWLVLERTGDAFCVYIYTSVCCVSPIERSLDEGRAKLFVSFCFTAVAQNLEPRGKHAVCWVSDSVSCCVSVLSPEMNVLTCLFLPDDVWGLARHLSTENHWDSAPRTSRGPCAL